MKKKKKQKVTEIPIYIRIFACTLYFISPKAYKYVREIFASSLPHPTTIRQWISSIKVTPGICIPALQVLKGKVNEAQKKGSQGLCNFVMDDMYLRKQMFFDGKKYCGIVDHKRIRKNDSQVQQNKIQLATQVTVIMAVCLTEHWKIPVAYYFHNGSNVNESADLLTQCLIQVHKIGIQVVGLTFDGLRTNLAMANKLGANLKGTGDLKAFFPHPVTKEPVFIIIDACHAIKLIRNTLGDKRVLYDGAGNPIQWHYFEELVKVQNLYGLHAATKIRKRHLNWQQEKMKVKLATQLLSASVAHAFNILRTDAKLPQFAGSDATEKFCQTINDVFDLLNSRTRIAKVRSKQCINNNNFDDINEKVNQFKAYISSIRDEETYILQSKRRIGFLGLIVTMENSLEIFRKWSAIQNSPLQYLLTYKLSQDHLELFFSAVRYRGSRNNNPNTKQFESALKYLLVYTQIKSSDYTNCKPQDATCLLQKFNSDTKYVSSYKSLCDTDKIIRTENSGESNFHKDIVPHPTVEHDYCIPKAFANVNQSYVKNVVAYIAGFIVRKLSAGRGSVKCLHCVKLISSDTCFSSLQKRKDQGKLTSASEDLIQVCYIAEQCFRSQSQKFFKPDTEIMSSLIETTLSHIPCAILNNTENCLGNHRRPLLFKVLKKYFTIRLHHVCTIESEENSRIRSKHTKLVLFNNQ